MFKILIYARYIMFALLLTAAACLFNAGAGVFVTGIVFNAGILFILMAGKAGEASD